MQNFNPPPHFSMKKPIPKKEVVSENPEQHEGFFSRLLQSFKTKSKIKTH